LQKRGDGPLVRHLGISDPAPTCNEMFTGGSEKPEHAVQPAYSVCVTTWMDGTVCSVEEMETS